MALLASSCWKLGILTLALYSGDSVSSRGLLWVHCTALQASCALLQVSTFLCESSFNPPVLQKLEDEAE